MVFLTLRLFYISVEAEVLNYCLLILNNSPYPSDFLQSFAANHALMHFCKIPFNQ